MPDPEKFEREPPEVMMSEAVKLIEASERENKRLATSPVASDEMSDPNDKRSKRDKELDLEDHLRGLNEASRDQAFQARLDAV